MSVDTYSLMNRLHFFWDAQNMKRIDMLLDKVFYDQENPYFICLELIKYSKNKRKPNCLGNYIFDRFDHHLRSRDELVDYISMEMKETVLEISSESHVSLAVKLIKLFAVDTPSFDLLMKYINCLYSEGKNINCAISLVTALNLQEKFSIFDIVIPAYMQGKLNLVENYLKGCEKSTKEMIELLDTWVDKDFDITSFCWNHGISGVKLLSQNHAKFLTKLLINSAHVKFAEQLCPNLCKKQSVGAIKHLLYRYYVEGCSSFENTLELLVKVVGKTEGLQRELIKLIDNFYKDYETARMLEQFFNLSGISLQRLSVGDGVSLIENKSDNIIDFARSHGCLATLVPSCQTHRYYTKIFDSDGIVIVNDERSMRCCEKAILENSELVGIDSEWSCIPSMKFGDETDIALVQLAIANHVFLLDVFAMMQNSCTEPMSTFLVKLFTSKKHIKIGYSLDGDLKKLSQTLPGMEPIVHDSSRVLDLLVAVRHLTRRFPEVLNPTNTECAEVNQLSGLSKLLYQTVGLPLDKREQISDWEKRPLHGSQIMYAALDAYCLLDIYNVLSQRLQDAGCTVSLEIFVTNPSAMKKNVPFPGRGRGKMLKNALKIAKEKQPKPLIPADSFRVVCDNMLNGLGLQLRRYGIDAVILANWDSHDKAALIAQREDRIILTCGAPFLYLCSQVPTGHCFKVPNDLKSEEQLACVIDHFGVKIESSDIFTRCQECNSGKFVLVKPDQMLMMIENRVDSSSTGIPWHLYQDDINSNQETSSSSIKLEEKCVPKVIVEEDYDSDNDVLFMLDDDDKEESRIGVDTGKFSDNINKKTVSEINTNLDKRSTSSKKSPHLHKEFAKSLDSQYVLNPKSLSVHSTLDLRNAVVITENPDSGHKMITPILYKCVVKSVCNTVEEFYCCIQCGKVYWEGNHYRKVLEKFRSTFTG